MEFFHVINRGVEKRDVFMEEGDYIRFIHDMYVFNDVRSAPNYVVKERQAERKRNQLVHIHAFCLMPNHYHLLLSPIEDNGISAFMQKINMGYAKYFNDKYDRSGVLWQGVFRKKPIMRDAHFMYIPYYIHLNPLDLAHPEWREGRVKNTRKALAYLEKYRWSSYLDYVGTPNFPSVMYKLDLQDILGGPRRQCEEINSILQSNNLSAVSSDLEM
ncbi:MAG: transposase [bacterium]|nr:transposase [bacterium]